MANPSTAHEPSMEEILASIRQIISEDGEAATGARSEPRFSGRPEPEGSGEAEVQVASAARPAPAALQRGDSDAVQEEPMKAPQPESPPKAAPHPITPASGNGPKANPDVPRRDLSPTIAQPKPDAEPQRHKAPPEDRTLLSERSDAAVSGAFSVLAHTILAQNARTLEDLVAEMLRPMLKDWLDENLPSLVEKLVKEEIERVSRGRR